MITALNAIIQWLGGVFDFLYTLGKWVLDGLLFVLGKALFFIFDALLYCVERFFQVLDFGTFLSTSAAQWANLPPQLIYCINQIGIPEAITMLTGAVLIRITINLIPAEFTRV